MIGDLTTFATRFESEFVNHLWQSTCFAILIWLITLLLKDERARTRHLLWLAASLKFFIPLSLLIGLGSYSFRLQPKIVPQGIALSKAAHVLEQPFTVHEQLPFLQTSVSQQSSPHWFVSAIGIVWLLGMTAVILLWVTKWRKAAAYLKDSLPANSGPEVDALRRMELKMGMSGSIAIHRSSKMNEPGIFGIFRPVLLWPERLTEKLQNENLDAILAHELMHVRRQDNLIAAIQMLAEAIFWFHPLVWWIGSRLLEERERACDEAAVEQTRKPEIYAESLLTACRLSVETPLGCISGITGADLRLRVLRILSGQIDRKMSLNRRLLLATLAITCLAAPLALGMLSAAQEQSNEKLPEFEVASIKPHKDDPSSGVMTGVRFTSDGVTVTGIPLSMLIRSAFGVSGDRVIGAPGWTKDARYDIVAKVAAEDVAPLRKIKMEDRFAMMLPLLTSRFGLKYHHETKELRVYALVVTKDGPKLTDSKVNEGDEKKHANQFIRVSQEGMTIAGANASIENLARSLSLQLGATVIDKTGLTGKYDYKMTWVPEQGMPMLPHGPGEGPEPGGGTTTRPTGPSLFAALQEQLGLKLESKKEPVNVIVIDHINQPSPN